MDKRTRIQKDLNDNADEKSSSLFSFSTALSSVGPIQSQNQGQDETVQGSKVKGVSVHDLPVEILMEILKCVDTRSLFFCRLVNRQWSAISTRILRKRPDTKTEFRFSNFTGFINYSTKSIGLKGFIHCFKASGNWPITRLSLIDDNHGLATSLFEHEDWLQFLSDYEISSVKSLKLEFRGHPHLILTEKIRDLLLDTFSHLEEFELFLSNWDGPPSEISLLPPTVHFQFQVPHLKILHFKDSMFKFYPQISRDLLNAAVNLKTIHVCPKSPLYNHFPQTFEFLHSVGKLHLLQEARIQLSEKFFSTVQKYKNSPFTFKLRELKLTTVPIFNSQSVWEEATEFLSNLFETSKDSLRKLCIQPLGFLQNLKFSRLKNLEELNLEHFSSPDPFFPAGVRNSDIFPAVHHLDSEFIHDWCAGFPGDDFIPRLPSLKALSVINRGIVGDAIAVMASLCPNLKDVKVHKDQNLQSAQLDFLQLGRSIWTHMKGLEYLEVDIDISSAGNDSLALNSCFTGIFMDNCQRLHEMMEEKQTLKKCGLSVDISRSNWRAEREHPSILDMKALRKLTLNTYDSTGNKCCFNKWSWVTREHVSKLPVYDQTLALGHFSNPILGTGSKLPKEAGAQEGEFTFAKLCDCEVCKQTKGEEDYFLIAHET